MIEISPGVRPGAECTVKRAKRQVRYRYNRTCAICGVTFMAARPASETCSVRCRKVRSRINSALVAAKKKKAAAAAAAAAKKRKRKKTSTKV